MADANNPYLRNGKWYWYDEAYEDTGPYDTKGEAEISLFKYCMWLNREKDGTSST